MSLEHTRHDDNNVATFDANKCAAVDWNATNNIENTMNSFNIADMMH